jgi:membrane-associated phospholipid phosphatase
MFKAVRIRSASPLILCTLVAAVWIGAACPVRADDGGGDLRWSPGWSRFSPAQYALTATMAASLIASNALLGPPSEPRWQRGILLDDDARSMLAARSARDRKIASSTSDFLALGLVAYPFIVDTLLVAGLAHGSPGVAMQMGLIGLQAVLVTALVTDLTKELVGRARPDAGRCAAGDKSACGSSTESFLSGHTSGAFVGAGLICANHQNLALYGDGPAGAIACGAALTAATAVGTLRIVADRHHLSDVLAGAALGLAAGYLLPNLTNYDFGKSKRKGLSTLSPMIGKGTFGLTYTRTF